MVNDVCLLKDEDAFRSEWKLARVVEVYPDRFGNVRNVEVLVKPAQDGSSIYKPSGGQLIRRHVNNLLLLVPVEEQDTSQTKTSVERAEDKSKAVAVEATVDAQLLRDASRNDEEDNRCKSSNIDIVESQSNVCQNFQEPGSTPSPQDDLEASRGLPAGRRGDWYQVPLLQEDVHAEGDGQLQGSYHEEFPQVKEAAVLCGLGKFWGDC